MKIQLDKVNCFPPNKYEIIQNDLAISKTKTKIQVLTKFRKIKKVMNKRIFVIDIKEIIHSLFFTETSFLLLRQQE